MWHLLIINATEASHLRQFENLFTESICTIYSNLSGRPEIFLGSGTFKKLGTLLFAKSRVQKTRVIVIQKERLPLLVLSNNDPVFCTLLFANYILDFFFKVPDPKKISGRPDKLE